MCPTSYCESQNKTTKESVCRFGFPKEYREQTEFVRDPHRDFPELHTRRNDALMNYYNSVFILGWRANIDFRPVVNREAILAYIAKYANKAETASSSYQEILQTAITNLKDSDHASIAYQKVLSALVAERDISSQEVSHVLLGCELTKSSCQFRSVCLLPGGSRL